MGVGFAIKSNLRKKSERPAGITDCIMKLRETLLWGWFLWILLVYAPTLQANEEVNLAFYGALHEVITKIPVEEKLIILGNFNARVGKDWETWDSLGCHGIGKINSNGLRLLELSSELKLVICNTFFHHKVMHECTWFHPRSKQGHLLDYIITRKRDLADVCNVRVLHSAECECESAEWVRDISNCLNTSIKNVSDVYWTSNGRLTHQILLCLKALSAQTLNTSPC